MDFIPFLQKSISSIPRLRSKIVDDLVEFIVPRLAKCEEVQCSGDGKHNTFLCTMLCKKKFLDLLRTQEKIFLVHFGKKPVVNKKPEKRKVMKLQK